MRELQVADLKVRLCGGSDGDGGGDGPLVVLLHGFGAPGDDLVGLASQLQVPAGTRFAFPEAPLALPPEFGGPLGRAWWMIDIMTMQMAMTGQLRRMTREAPDGLAPANAAINGVLDALQEQLGFDPAKLVLGGFSQGAMLACDVVLRSERPFAGLAILSGTFIAADEWTPRMEKREGLAVLQSHGREDPLLPFAIAESLRDALVGAGAELLWVPFAGGHGIAPGVLRALSDFISGALTDTTSSE